MTPSSRCFNIDNLLKYVCSHFLFEGSSYLEILSGVAQLTQGVNDLDLEGMYLDSDEDEDQDEA